jgi:hypothetical protein
MFRYNEILHELIELYRILKIDRLQPYILLFVSLSTAVVDILQYRLLYKY